MHPLNHPAPIAFFAYFNFQEDYFECHEVFEDYWKEIAPREREHALVGWIQFATGMYHWRRDNFQGATTIFKKAYTKLTNNDFLTFVNIEETTRFLASAIEKTASKQAFEKFIIPITDQAVAKKIAQFAQLLPPVDTQFLLHKHKLRDRSEVIALREKNKQNRLH